MKTMSAQGTTLDVDGSEGGVSDEVLGALEDTLAKAGRKVGNAAPKGFKMSDMGALSLASEGLDELLDDDAIRRSGRLKIPEGFSVKGMDRRLENVLATGGKVKQ